MMCADSLFPIVQLTTESPLLQDVWPESTGWCAHAGTARNSRPPSANVTITKPRRTAPRERKIAQPSPRTTTSPKTARSGRDRTFQFLSVCEEERIGGRHVRGLATERSAPATTRAESPTRGGRESLYVRVVGWGLAGKQVHPILQVTHHPHVATRGSRGSARYTPRVDGRVECDDTGSGISPSWRDSFVLYEPR
jgi:hypothetical protein